LRYQGLALPDYIIINVFCTAEKGLSIHTPLFMEISLVSARKLYGKRVYLDVHPSAVQKRQVTELISFSKGLMLRYAFVKKKTSENLRYILGKRM